jgi:hypothetical protein
MGTARIQVTVTGQRKALLLTDALYCPELKANLVSASQLLKKKVKITLEDKGSTLEGPPSNVVTEVRHFNGLFIIPT